MRTTTGASTLIKVSATEWALDVTLGGSHLWPVTVTEDKEWDEDTDGSRYTVDSEQGSDETNEWETVRELVATHARGMRADAAEEQEDAANDALVGLLEKHHDAGTSASLLKRLRALGVI